MRDQVLGPGLPASSRRRATRRVALPAALLALIAIGIVVTTARFRSTDTTAVVARRGAIARTLVLTGRVRAPARARIGASVTGTVREVRVREGDHVARGALLLVLDDAPAAAALAQARAALAIADARAHATADQAALTATQAERDLARARAAVAAAEAQLALTRVAAPSGATVLTRDVEPGDLVMSGRMLFDVATELVAYPREENLAELRPGARAVASADAFPTQSFAARLASVAPVVDPGQGTVEIRLAVPAPPSYLRADMTVSINIEVARHDAAIVLPFDRVGDASGGAPWVVVERDGRAERRSVRLGLQGDGAVEILSGIREGERVLPATVPPSARVRVRELPDSAGAP